MKSSVSFQIGVLGGCPLGDSLKIGALDVGSKPFTLQGEAGSCEFLLDCTSLCQGWGLWQECVSAFPTSFNAGFFLIYPICRIFSASFWIILKRKLFNV